MRRAYLGLFLAALGVFAVAWFEHNRPAPLRVESTDPDAATSRPRDEAIPALGPVNAPAISSLSQGEVLLRGTNGVALDAAAVQGEVWLDVLDAAGVTKRELRSEVSAGRLALDLRPGETVRFTGGRFAEATALLLAPVGPVLLSATTPLRVELRLLEPWTLPVRSALTQEPLDQIVVHGTHELATSEQWLPQGQPLLARGSAGVCNLPEPPRRAMQVPLTVWVKATGHAWTRVDVERSTPPRPVDLAPACTLRIDAAAVLALGARRLRVLRADGPELPLWECITEVEALALQDLTDVPPGYYRIEARLPGLAEPVAAVLELTPTAVGEVRLSAPTTGGADLPLAKLSARVVVHPSWAARGVRLEAVPADPALAWAALSTREVQREPSGKLVSTLNWQLPAGRWSLVLDEVWPLATVDLPSASGLVVDVPARAIVSFGGGPRPDLLVRRADGDWPPLRVPHMLQELALPEGAAWFAPAPEASVDFVERWVRVSAPATVVLLDDLPRSVLRVELEGHGRWESHWRGRVRTRDGSQSWALVPREGTAWVPVPPGVDLVVEGPRFADGRRPQVECLGLRAGEQRVLRLR